MIYERHTDGSVEDVAERLTRAVAENGFGVISQLDLRGKMHDKGIEFGPTCWIVEVCNPTQAKRVLGADIRLANLLPCRIAVYGEEGSLTVGTLRPSRLVQLLGADALAPVASEVEDALISVIDDARMGG